MIKPSSEKCRVLIVDDDPRISSLLAEIVEGAGYEVVCAADGGAAWPLVESFAPDVVISDVLMPVLNGLELCRRIKSDARTADVPVILISGLRNAIEDSVHGWTAGADEY